MIPTFFKTLLLFLLLIEPFGIAATQKRTNQKKTKITAPVTTPKTETETALSPFFVQSTFGVSRWEGWGFLSGLGLGVFPSLGNKLGWGFEGRLHLVSQGSLFTLLGGAWYFINPPYLSQRFIALGLLVGAGFPGGVVSLNKTAIVGLFEIASHHRLSDYSWFKVWSRAGLIDKQATAQLGFSLLFQLK